MSSTFMLFSSWESPAQFVSFTFYSASFNSDDLLCCSFPEDFLTLFSSCCSGLDFSSFLYELDCVLERLLEVELVLDLDEELCERFFRF